MEESTICPTCRAEVKLESNFCARCGTNLLSEHEIDLETRNIDRGQILIFIGLMILCGSTIFYFITGLIGKLTNNWEFYDTIEPLSLMIGFAAGGIALLIAFGLNRGTLKAVAIIVAAIYTLIHLYWLIDRIMPDETEPFEYLQF